MQVADVFACNTLIDMLPEDERSKADAAIAQAQTDDEKARVVSDFSEIF